MVTIIATVNRELIANREDREAKMKNHADRHA